MDLFLASERRPGPRVSRWWLDQDGVDMEGIQTVDGTAECTKGGGDGYDGDGDIISQWEDIVANLIFGTEPNFPLTYVPRLEQHHPIMSTLGDPRNRLYIYIYI